MDQGYLQKGCSRPDYRNSRRIQDGGFTNGDRTKDKQEIVSDTSSVATPDKEMINRYIDYLIKGSSDKVSGDKHRGTDCENS